MSINDAWFDVLAKMLASGVPRRQFLKVLGGAALGLTGFGSSTTLAETWQSPPDQAPVTASQAGICPHRGRQQFCNGACCAENGSCETKGHNRGVSCEHGQCCSVGETCCGSVHPSGQQSEVCCGADETCVQIPGPGGSVTGVCRPATPLL